MNFQITTKSTTTALGTFDRLTISQKTSRSMSSSSISVDQKIDEQRNSRKYSGISRPSKFSHVKTHEKPLQESDIQRSLNRNYRRIRFKVQEGALHKASIIVFFFLKVHQKPENLFGG